MPLLRKQMQNILYIKNKNREGDTLMHLIISQLLPTCGHIQVYMVDMEEERTVSFQVFLNIHVFLSSVKKCKGQICP